MKNSIVAAISGFAASALALGGSQVINACEAQVSLCAVPAYGDQQEKILSTGETYFHEWEVLTTGGWSIKMYPMDGTNDGTNITQYEWNMDDGVTIWWDMSDVNGCPFGNSTDGEANWFPYTSSDSCSSVQKSYQYSTNDIAMEAPCYDQEAVITILLCQNSTNAPDLISKYNLKKFTEDGVATSAVSAASGTTSVSAYSGTAYSSATSAAAQTTSSSAVAATSVSAYSSSETASSTTAAQTHAHTHSGYNENAAVPSTTLSTAVSAAESPLTTTSNGVVIVTETQVYTQNVNEIITITAGAHKRHEHRHPHGPHHA